MINIARLLLVGLAVALLAGAFGGATPAQASFSASASVTPMQVATGTVAAPTDVVGTLTCGRQSATMAATWTASTSPKVSGYLVTVYFSDGYVQTVQLAATATSWSAPIDPFYVTAYSVQYSVTTQTSFGWMAESARTPWFKC